ncbi:MULTISPECIES: alpha/beta hydrolase [unclassified Sphingomonas]|uniref:alpha/beta hydrolase n=1 Tax=unclassified Sphingomonas TaxID=196159 RepID=UPI0006F39F9B|nr:MULTISPECIES: alpha/beta hydrolase [unclassified Sphingomonas]KRB92934.1 hypothetical protein ASE22_25900 [Sphingomonas sp. Root720]
MVEAREIIGSLVQFQRPPEDIASVETTTYPGAAGPLPIRIFRPILDKTLPVILFLHGGGWMAGDIDLLDGPCRSLANATGALVISAAYRLAPENPFPAAPDDAFAALQWVQAHCNEYGGDPTRLAVAGESGGGTLAATTALRARDAGGPALAAQILLYPAIDPDADTASRTEYGDGYLITAKAVDWMWRQYLPDPTLARLASPARASSLAGLPPTLVVTMEYDALRDEGEAFAEQLRQAGVTVEQVRIDGLIHASMTLSALTDKTDQIYAAAGRFLQHHLAAVPDTVEP